jgi:hypothetical protein
MHIQCIVVACHRHRTVEHLLGVCVIGDDFEIG